MSQKYPQRRLDTAVAQLPEPTPKARVFAYDHELKAVLEFVVISAGDIKTGKEFHGWKLQSINETFTTLPPAKD